MTADPVPRPRLKAPFPWFGGKSRCAPQVWGVLGDVDLYVEPFAGSLAVLLGRPATHKGKREVVNDADDFIVNFWRAVKHDPEAVAKWADWPVTEADLFARHMWLVRNREELANTLQADPEAFDAKVAGWWVWGICAWIGGGWCSGNGPWQVVDGRVVKQEGAGAQKRLPQLTCYQGIQTAGVHAKRPHLTHPQGIRKAGARSELPHPGNLRGIQTESNTLAWLEALADRLRHVLVVSGDWSRVVTNGATVHGNAVGIFLDPPYDGEVRTKNMYAVEGYDLAKEVRDWAVERGEDRRYRIVLAGYDLEHDDVVPDTWRRVRWLANSSYQTRASAAREGGNSKNRHREVLWCSPGCLGPTPTLFE